MGFSLIKPPFWGTPMTMETPISFWEPSWKLLMGSVERIRVKTLFFFFLSGLFMSDPHGECFSHLTFGDGVKPTEVNHLFLCTSSRFYHPICQGESHQEFSAFPTPPSASPDMTINGAYIWGIGRATPNQSQQHIQHMEFECTPQSSSLFERILHDRLTIQR